MVFSKFIHKHKYSYINITLPLFHKFDLYNCQARSKGDWCRRRRSLSEYWSRKPLVMTLQTKYQKYPHCSPLQSLSLSHLSISVGGAQVVMVAAKTGDDDGHDLLLDYRVFIHLCAVMQFACKSHLKPFELWSKIRLWFTCGQSHWIQGLYMSLPW